MPFCLCRRAFYFLKIERFVKNIQTLDVRIVKITEYKWVVQ
jgi:hypothetical protein